MDSFQYAPLQLNFSLLSLFQDSSSDQASSFISPFISSYTSQGTPFLPQSPSAEIDLHTLSLNFRAFLEPQIKVNGSNTTVVGRSRLADKKKKVFTVIRESEKTTMPSAGNFENNSPCSPITDVDGERTVPGSASKRYCTFSKAEKQKILEFMEAHGTERTLQTYENLTRRKLKHWVENLNKVKKLVGKRTNDPIRDQGLFEWCEDFEQQYGRRPNRKELRQKALELSNVPTFQASKGWLDKFCKKIKVDVSSAGKKIQIKKEDEVSSLSTIGTGSPLSFDTIDRELSLCCPSSGKNEIETEGVSDNDVDSFFNFSDDMTPLRPLEHEDVIPSLEYNHVFRQEMFMRY